MKGSPAAHKQIASTLIHEIEQGTWGVGAKLPTEMDLVDRFGVSRNTVREALRHLQDLGFIRRKQGSRSVLLRKNPENAFVNIASSVDDILLYVRDTDSQLLACEHVIVGEDLAEALACEAGVARLRASFLRFRAGSDEPICYTEAYVLPDFEDVRPKLEQSATVYNVIAAHFGIAFARIEQEIEARRADANVASRLRVSVGSPLLFVKTTFYCPDDSVAEISLSHFPEQRYRLRITRERAVSGGVRAAAKDVL